MSHSKILFSDRDREYKLRKTLERLEENGIEETVKCLMDIANRYLGFLWDSHSYLSKQLFCKEDVSKDYIKRVLREEIETGNIQIKEENVSYVTDRLHEKLFHGSK